MEKAKEENSMKFRLVQMPGDGDCFYHAVVAGLRRSSITIERLRQYVARNIASQSDLFQDLVTEFLDFGIAQRTSDKVTFVDSGQQVTAARAAARIQNGEWATSTAIHILASGLKVQICVVQEINGKLYTERFPSEWKKPLPQAKRKIYLYKTSQHFDLLEIVASSSSESEKSLSNSWSLAILVAVFAICTL